MSFGYSSTGSYKKTKWWIDVVNIVLSIAITAIFVASFWWDFINTYRYVTIFGLGTVMNGLACIKKFLDYNNKAGILLLVATVLLAIITIISLVMVN